MAFPVLPKNGQITVVNNISYTYEAASNAWYRTGETTALAIVTDTAVISSNTASTSTTTGALTVAGGVGVAGNVYVGAVYTDSYFYADGTPFSTAGALGYTGSAGTNGFTGSAGTNGYTGSKGDTGLGFTIAKTYSSVAALTADTSPTGIVAGQFAVIETGNVDDTENSRLYLWNGSAYSYVSDLSGATGFTGPAGGTGFTGSAGTDGYTGSAGTNGFTGSAGTNGFTGSTGSAGTDGYTGSAGTNGFTGSTGFTGSVGYTGSKGESSFTWGPTPPSNPEVGDRWYDTNKSKSVVYVNDGNSSQWVETAANGFLGRTGYTGSAGTGGGNTPAAVGYSLIFGV